MNLPTLRKESIKTMPDFFTTYIDRCPDVPLLPLLTETQHVEELISVELLQSHRNYAYADTKWTVAQVLQHIIDTERIFAYRALRFARNDQTPLPGFDEQLYGSNAPVDHRTIEDLLEEFTLVRRSTLMLFTNFPADAYARIGTANGCTIDVLAIGFAAAGHVLHHIAVLKERYFMNQL